MNGTKHKLYDGTLYWPKTMPIAPTYPSLRTRIITQVAIIGGGVTGAICAAVLANAGIKAVLVEGKRVASASTAANTGLIQFTNDIMLSELAERIGEDDAARFYCECRKALNSLSELASSIPLDMGFNARSSLYCASTDKDAERLLSEYRMLRKHGFPVNWGFPESLGSRLPSLKAAALVTRGDAEINPVRLAHGLIVQAARSGAQVFENTGIVQISKRNDRFVLQAEHGEINAQYIVRATGYLPGVETPRTGLPILRRSYALATKPDSLPTDWPNRMMMWETDRPYFYFRTTPDGRIIAGGLDENRADPDRNASGLQARTNDLLAELSRLFPDSAFEAEDAWCGVFGESKDHLPLLGEHPDQPGIFHALGYGGNGTIYGTIAAFMLLAQLKDNHHPLKTMLSPGRGQLQEETSARIASPV